MSYTLEPPATDADWLAFHDIREDVLFIARGRPRGFYDRNHPHDSDPLNQPLLLKEDGRPIGTTRLDNLGDGTGCVRLVAVVATEQGRGHGRVMQQLLVARARAKGMHTLVVNSAPTAVGFYEKLGWTIHSWDPKELVGVAEDCVQMRKLL